MSQTSSAAQPMDIGRVLDASDWTAFQKSVVCLVSLTLIFDGLDSQVLGLAIPALIADWQVGRAQFAPIAAIGLIGMSLGTFVGGWAGDRIGRKSGLLLSVLVFGAATAAAALVDSLGALGTARAIAGLGLGGALPNATAMIAEYTPKRSRSVAIAIGMVSIPLGSMIASLVAAAIIEDLGWRALFAIGGIPPVVLVLFLAWAMPESPHFLARRPERRRELDRLLERSGCRIEPDTQLVAKSSEARRARLSALFGAAMRTDTLLLWSAFFLTLVALYSVVSWAPEMLSSEGFALSLTGTALAAFALGGIAGSVSSGYMLTFLGSKAATIMLAGGGGFVAVGSGMLFSAAEPPVTIVMLVFALLGFSCAGMQNCLYTLSAHLYTTETRATGIGAALGVGRLGAVASSFTGALSLDLGGGALFFVFVAVSLALAAIAAASVRNPLRAVAGAH